MSAKLLSIRSPLIPDKALNYVVWRRKKIRFSGRGKGKSGGYRVVVAYLGLRVPVYLLALLSKGDRENFSAAEIAAFKVMTTAIGRYWRERTR